MNIENMMPNIFCFYSNSTNWAPLKSWTKMVYHKDHEILFIQPLTTFSRLIHLSQFPFYGLLVHKFLRIDLLYTRFSTYIVFYMVPSCSIQVPSGTWNGKVQYLNRVYTPKNGQVLLWSNPKRTIAVTPVRRPVRGGG